MKLKLVSYMTFAIVMAVILSGCNLSHALTLPTATPALATNAAAPTDTMAPVQDQNLINTQAAQTVAAVLTLNVPSATPVTPTVVTATPVPPTDTPTSMATPTVTQTFTPVILTIAPTNTLIYYTKTPSSTPNGYACQVTSTTPTSSVKVSTTFNWTWVIKNTGSAMWGQHNADIRYISGTKMQTGADLYDLTKNISPGQSYTATIAMETPSSANTYTAIWTIVQDGVTACTLNLSLNVTN
jgi:hypothetical protein